MGKKYTHEQKITSWKHVASGKSRREAAALSGYSLQLLQQDFPRVCAMIRAHPNAPDSQVAQKYLKEYGLA